jgi:nitrous oxidase accessory protein NosD
MMGEQRTWRTHRTTLALTLTFIMMLWVLAVAGTQFVKPVMARTITVPDDYATIQEAINSAADGDTIYIREGTYMGDLNITKHISLKGQNPESTIIHGCIVIRTSNVMINSLKLLGFGRWEQLKTFINGYGILTLSGQAHSFGNLQETWETTVRNCIFENWIIPIALASGDGERIINNTILNSDEGIDVGTFNNVIAYNTISCGGNGILLGSQYITGNLVYGNHISDAEKGIFINCFNYDNDIIGNTIAGCQEGIHLGAAPERDYPSSGNLFFHNNLLDNSKQVLITAGSSDIWDNGYPSGGNYWSNYQGSDTNSDGIGDTAYTIDAINQDRYPLMKPYQYSDTGYHAIDFTQAFKDNSGNPLATLPSSFKLTFPNGTTSSPLVVGSYLIPSGLTEIHSIIWQGTDATPSTPLTFDAASGIAPIKCKIYELTVDPIIYSIEGNQTYNQTYKLIPSTWTLTFPNKTTATLSSRITYPQTQAGLYSLGNVVMQNEIIELFQTLLFTRNTVWSPSFYLFKSQSNQTFAFDSNSTIAEPDFNSTDQMLSFTASGPDGTNGYTKISFDESLVVDPNNVTVLQDGEQINFNLTSKDNSMILSINYTHSIHDTIVQFNSGEATPIPEFPSWAPLPLILTATTLVLVFRKRLYHRISLL